MREKREDTIYTFLKAKEQVEVIEFPIFAPFKNLHALYSTKKGGISTGVYESMNLSYSLGDTRENVKKNYEIIGKYIDIDIHNMVTAKQMHHHRIRVVTKEDIGKGVVKEVDYTDIDGLVTSEKEVCIVTHHADCAAIFFYDPVKEVIGLAHAGWQGTVLEIPGEMVKKMVTIYGSNPKDILVAISPAISASEYEIDIDVKRKFDAMSVDVEEFIFYNEKCDKYYPDIAQINRKVLLASGIQEHNIQLTNICTKKEKNLFFSHRRQGKKRGSQAAFMVMKA